MKKKSCLLFAVCMMFLLAGCAEKINLNEYLEVEYEGVNEYATATYEIDYMDLITDYEEIFGFDDDDLEDEDGEDFLEDMEDAISGELNEDKKLKNGLSKLKKPLMGVPPMVLRDGSLLYHTAFRPVCHLLFPLY